MKNLVQTAWIRLFLMTGTSPHARRCCAVAVSVLFCGAPKIESEGIAADVGAKRASETRTSLHQTIANLSRIRSAPSVPAIVRDVFGGLNLMDFHAPGLRPPLDPINAAPGPCVPVPGVIDKCPAWISSYDGPGHGAEGQAPYAFNGSVMASSPDGRLVYTAALTNVGTQANGQLLYNYVVIAVDAATGEQRWASIYPGTSDLPNPVVDALAVSPTGSSVYVTGYLYNGDTFQEAIATVGFDANTGQQLWAVLVSLATSPDVTLSPDGRRVFVVGTIYGANPEGGSYEHAATFCYDAVTGQELWSSQYHGSGADRAIASRVAVKADGSLLYVAGGKLGSNGSINDLVLLTYNPATGALLHEAHHPASANPPSGIALSDSRIFVAASINLTNPGGIPVQNALTIGYDKNGNELWSAIYNEEIDPQLPSYYYVNYDGPITASPDGSRVFVTMHSNSLLGDGMVTVAYDAASGSQQWASRDDSSSEFFCIGCNGPLLQINPDGEELYTTEVSDVSPETAEFKTICYDTATGTKKWSSLYREGTDLTQPFAMALSPNGARVFIAGTRAPLNGTSDLVALAYDTGAPPPVPLIGVVSRKVHGSAGQFDIDLPIHGTGIECRSGGESGNHTLVFDFANPLSSVGGVSVSGGNGSITSSGINGTDPHRYIIELTGAGNAQTLDIRLTNVTDSAGNSSSGISTSVGFILGDVSGNSAVTNTDVAAVKGQVAAPVDSSNFRNDVNANGVISNTDVSAAKAQVGTSLP
jgi:PQQ-like domain